MSFTRQPTSLTPGLAKKTPATAMKTVSVSHMERMKVSQWLWFLSRLINWTYRRSNRTMTCVTRLQKASLACLSDRKQARSWVSQPNSLSSSGCSSKCSSYSAFSTMATKLCLKSSQFLMRRSNSSTTFGLPCSVRSTLPCSQAWSNSEIIWNENWLTNCSKLTKTDGRVQKGVNIFIKTDLKTFYLVDHLFSINFTSRVITIKKFKLS